jgi:hypothetical protein
MFGLPGDNYREKSASCDEITLLIRWIYHHKGLGRRTYSGNAHWGEGSERLHIEQHTGKPPSIKDCPVPYGLPSFRIRTVH